MVASSILDFVDNPYDGFVLRHSAFVRRLIADPAFDVSLVALRREGQRQRLVEPFASTAREIVLGESRSPSRAERLHQATSLITRSHPGVTNPLAAFAHSDELDVALTIGPWLETEYRAVFERLPTVHFFEEDAFALPHLGSQSRVGRAFRRVEEAAGWLAKGQPKHVIVITDDERRAARRRYRGAEVTTIRYSLPIAQWPLGLDLTGAEEDVLVLGVLRHERNARGLVDLLDVLVARGEDRIPFRIVSDSGLHPDILPFLTLPWVRHVPSLTPAYEDYRHARLALVPARQATGVKTTVLQGWASKVPVVTYAESARTLDLHMQSAVCSASTPELLADQLVSLWDNHAERDRLRRTGAGILSVDFDPDTSYAQLTHLLRRAAHR